MKQYKFRAWHKDAREMIYEDWPGEVFKWLHEGQPVEIMQWTGLIDQNGKDIYEGDILRGRTYLYGYDLESTGGKQFDYCGIVEWGSQCDAGLCWMLEDIDGIGFIELRSTVHRNMVDYSTGDIIGNAHQHPHLLKS